MASRYHCGRRERRDRVADSALSGIDFVEVFDTEAPEPSRQKLLLLRLLQPLEADTLGAENVVVEGGVRVTGIQVLWARRLVDVTDIAPAAASAAERALLTTWLEGADDRDHYLVIRVDGEGDYSAYTLRLVTAADDPAPPPGFDVRLAEVALFFKVECPSDFDCKSERPCPPDEFAAPRIDYLAKDYASFRRLMLERMRVLAPSWRERNPADLGVALVEILAYTADQLSYRQDAIATEAYLGTARRRISVRRHARLVDYALHEGVNARVWVEIQVDQPVTLPGPESAGRVHGVRLATAPRPEVLESEGGPPVIAEERIDVLTRAGSEVFETLHSARLVPELRALRFYTWSDRECCLPIGATEATVHRTLPSGGQLPDAVIASLPGTFLLLEEVLGPRTGAAADADPEHRQVVRVMAASAGTDLLDGTPIVEMRWHPEDALRFPVCVSARTDADHGARFVEDVSIARGNLVLADHGRTIEDEDLGTVPDPADRFAPMLEQGPLTHAAPLPSRFLPVAAAAVGDPDGPDLPASAARADRFDAGSALPAIRLESGLIGWSARRDLLSSGRFDQHFVAEVDDRGRAHLRFGDDLHGRRPDVDSTFAARYRIGGGLDGNVGRESVTLILSEPALDLDAVVAVRNPLPAAGGEAPESLEEARRDAPEAFREQERAVTEADYARAAERHPEVQRAAATFRWTGSWHTVFVTVDRRGGRAVDEAFESALRRHLAFFRLAGHDLEIDGPRFVPLDIRLEICVSEGHRSSDVHRELLRVLSADELPEGGRGYFHPDRWSFGQPLYLSSLIAVASAVPGVASVMVSRFARWREEEREEERERGEMRFGRLEIPRLDNDPSLQENGLLAIALGPGGGP